MNKIKAGSFLIGSTLIWAAVIIGTALVLKGTPFKETVNRILFIGVIVHIQLFNIILFWKSSSEGSIVKRSGLLIILSAVIWGAVLIVSAYVLRGTEYKEQATRVIQNGPIAHLILIWGPIGVISQKKAKGIKQSEKENDNDLKDA